MQSQISSEKKTKEESDVNKQSESLLLQLHDDPMQKMTQYLHVKDIFALSLCNRYLFKSITKSTHGIAVLDLNEYITYFDPNLDCSPQLLGCRKLICTEEMFFYPQLFGLISKFSNCTQVSIHRSIDVVYNDTFVPSNWELIKQCASISLTLKDMKMIHMSNILQSLTNNLHQLTINEWYEFELFEIISKAQNLSSLDLTLPTQAFNDPILFDDRYEMISTRIDISLWNTLTSFSFGPSGFGRARCYGKNCVCNIYRLILVNCTNLQTLQVHMDSDQCAKKIFQNMKELNFNKLVKIDLNMSWTKLLSEHYAMLLEHITNCDTKLNEIHLTIYDNMSDSLVTAVENLLMKYKLRYIKFTVPTKSFNWFSFLNRVLSQKIPSRQEFNLDFNIVKQKDLMGYELGPLLDTLQQIFYFPVITFNCTIYDESDKYLIHEIETTHQWIARETIKEYGKYGEYEFRRSSSIRFCCVENIDYNLEECYDEEVIYKLQLREELNEEKRWKYEVNQYIYEEEEKQSEWNGDEDVLFGLTCDGSTSDDIEYVIASEFDVDFNNYITFYSAVQLNINDY
eukprot:62551_1